VTDRDRTIRTATLTDIPAVRDIAIGTGLFDADGWLEVEPIMVDSVSGALDGHVWIVLEDDTGTVLGAAYYAPEPFAHRMWNMYFLGVRPGHQGDGTGGALVRHVEAVLRERGERVLIIETSSTDTYEATRRFYRSHGYDEEARIREFYGPNDDKVVFWKSLQSSATDTTSGSVVQS
jgi:ribosomal protein S18 acetylase RimI-like enzyme